MHPSLIERHPRAQAARWVDAVLAAILLVLLAPVLLLLAALVRLGGGPVIYSQRRLGRGGVPFLLHKFRTLEVRTGHAPSTVTPTDAPEVTASGRALRALHLDELPQLWNVFRGQMAFVGPRPEVPANLVAVPEADLAAVQTVRPGLTGPTQLAFLGEDDALDEADDPVRAYREILVPAKVRADLAWLPRRGIWRDLGVLARTPFAILSPWTRARSRDRVRRLLEDSRHAPPPRPPHSAPTT